MDTEPWGEVPHKDRALGPALFSLFEGTRVLALRWKVHLRQRQAQLSGPPTGWPLGKMEGWGVEGTSPVLGSGSSSIRTGGNVSVGDGSANSVTETRDAIHLESPQATES